jgi:hypothetical protein
MRNTFLDYYKIVLDKVSFDRNLFLKEYDKALSLLSAQEVIDLNRWLESKDLLSLLRKKERAAPARNAPGEHLPMNFTDRGTSF